MTPVVWIVVAVVIVVLAIAAAVLMRRRPRLRDLPDESRARYADQWRVIETRFVDQPREAVQEADAMAVAMYRERGVKVDDGDRVPGEVERARGLAHSDGEAGDTERLRRAMVAYQRIVDEAVGERTRRASEARRREVTG